MATNKKLLKAYVTNEEYEKITKMATECRLSISRFIARACSMKQLRSKVDSMAVVELARINADLSRLGNLYKQGLNRQDENEAKTRSLLKQLEAVQEELKENMCKLI